MAKKRKKQLKPDERYWELHVVPVKRSKKEDYEDVDLLWKGRIENWEKENGESSLHLKMNYLRWQVKKYLKDNVFREKLTFGHFLKEYITRLDRPKEELAKEIGVSEMTLTGFINDNVLPDESIFHRLELHSNHSILADQWHKMIDGRKRVRFTNDMRLLEEARSIVCNPIPVNLPK